MSLAASPLVVISILNWNGWKDTLECLESVRRLDYPNFLTVVVDNGSWNGSADKIKAWAEANLGLATLSPTIHVKPRSPAAPLKPNKPSKICFGCPPGSNP